jgi:hypothetical protein
MDGFGHSDGLGSGQVRQNLSYLPLQLFSGSSVSLQNC